MIIPILMAILFGLRARKVGRSGLAWAIGGACLTFVVATILANLGVLLVAGSLTGPVELETFMAIRVVTALLTVFVMLGLLPGLLPDSRSAPESV